MKIIIVRHGDPDYENDSLTEKGKIEAKLLADRLCKENITALYCSTLGRARATAKPTVDRLGIEAQYCDWLREFEYARVVVPGCSKDSACWDILPETVNEYPMLYDRENWQNVEFIKNSDLFEKYKEVCDNLDRIILRHGYRKDGAVFRAENPNHDTIVIVCHYGVSAILLAHLLNCSPYTIWQNCVLLPTSVTTIHTEERREGIASLRMCGMGDISHLYSAGQEPSFSARFCECFTDETRHD